MSAGRFYLANNEFDIKFKKLKNSFRSRMNGEISFQMKQRGINYKQNFGISIPHVKEMKDAFSFTPSECERLWFHEIRETMLMAAMLLPDDELTPVRMNEFSMAIKNIDIAEQSAFFMFSRMPDLDRFIADISLNDNEFVTATAFFAAGRALQTGRVLTPESIDRLVQCVGSIMGGNQGNAMRSVSFFVRQSLRKSLVTNQFAESLMAELRNMGTGSSLQLAEELQMELDYLSE